MSPIGKTNFQYPQPQARSFHAPSPAEIEITVESLCGRENLVK